MDEFNRDLIGGNRCYVCGNIIFHDYASQMIIPVVKTNIRMCAKCTLEVARMIITRNTLAQYQDSPMYRRDTLDSDGKVIYLPTPGQQIFIPELEKLAEKE